MRSIKRRASRSKKILVLLSVLVVAFVIFLISVVIQKQVDQKYKKQIQTLKQVNQEVMAEVYVAKEKLSAGDIITKENMEKKNCAISMTSDQYITEEDFGKVLLIDVDAEVPLIQNMVIQKVEGGVREVQCDEVLLNDNLEENDYVDVRISLPNGEDFVVLSKKAIHGLMEEEAKKVCYLWLTEEEIKQYTMAVVEASLSRGARLYTTKYLQATVQHATEVSYNPDSKILEKLSEENMEETDDIDMIYDVWEE